MSEIFRYENQFIARFPEGLAEQIGRMIDSSEDGQIEITPEIRKTPEGLQESSFAFKVGEQRLRGTIMDMPCIIESFKTIDNINLFKSNDISQMVVVHDPAEQPPEEHEEYIKDRRVRRRMISGVSIPMKNVRARYFKRKLDVDRAELHEVEKQLQKIAQEIAPNNREEKVTKPKRKYHKKV